MWNSRPPPVNPPSAVQPTLVQPSQEQNVGWAPPTGTDPNAAGGYYGQTQMTPEQYKQWETYYQQYNAWYVQYGEQYAKLQGATAAAPPPNPYPGVPTYPGVAMNTGVYPQPPLPQVESHPAPPPPAEPAASAPGYVAAKAGPVTYQQAPPPIIPQQQQQQPYQSQSHLSKWGHKPQVKVSQRIQYGTSRANNNNMGQQQNNRWSGMT